MTGQDFRRTAAAIVAAGAFALGMTPAAAQGDRSFEGPFVVERALEIIYGGSTWQDAELLNDPGYDDGRAFVAPLFDAAYVEDSVEKHIVIATLTPRPRSQNSCHACSPLQGGAVFRASGDSWEIEAVGRIIGLGHAWYGLSSSLRLVRIGPERYGLLHRIEDIHGGYEDKSLELIFAQDGMLAIQFAAPPVSGPGPGACGIPEEQHLRLTFDGSGVVSREADAGLFDLLVDRRWNDARCRILEDAVATFEGQVCHRVSRYEFRDGGYTLVGNDIDECTALPENVRISLKG
jgi:hypothetical protein